MVVIPHSLILKEPEIQAITDLSELDQTLVQLLDDFLENLHPVLLLAITTKPLVPRRTAPFLNDLLLVVPTKLLGVVLGLATFCPICR